jgi:superfamily II DNA/RNA helicase
MRNVSRTKAIQQKYLKMWTKGSIDGPIPAEMQRLVARIKDKFKVNPHAFQLHSIHAALKGNDVLVRAATGSGKGLIYQALILEKETGVLLCVCPILGLMENAVDRPSGTRLTLQVIKMKALGFTAVVVCQETLNEDPTLITKVKNGEFQFVFAMPEILLDPAKEFQTCIFKDPKCAFRKNLVAVAIDECHLIWDWGKGGFRHQYAKLGLLKSILDNAPWICLSETLTANVASYVHRVLKLRDYTVRFDCPIRQDNINIIRARLEGDGTRQVISMIRRNVTDVKQMRKMIVFIDKIDPGQALADQISLLLPKTIKNGEKDVPVGTVVQVYHGGHDPVTKKKTIEDLMSGDCRIVICTDAFGVGIDIPDIEIVVQLGVDDRLTFCGLAQRIGRAARTSGMIGIAIILVPGRLLDSISKNWSKSKDAWKEAWSSEELDLTDFDPESHVFKEEEIDALRLVPVKDRDLKRYGLPVSAETNQLVREHVLGLYRDAKSLEELIRDAKSETVGSKGKRLSLAQKLDPPLLWFLCTRGCLHMVLGAVLQDLNIYHRTHKSWCCDSCAFDKANPGTLSTAGISVLRSVLNPEPSVPKPKPGDNVRKGPVVHRYVHPSHTDICRYRINLWRNLLWTQVFLRRHPHADERMVLSDPALDFIIKNLSKIQTRDDLLEQLRQGGFPLQFWVLSPNDYDELFNLIDFILNLKITVNIQPKPPVPTQQQPQPPVPPPVPIQQQPGGAPSNVPKPNSGIPKATHRRPLGTLPFCR